jgi:hypothetical protein
MRRVWYGAWTHWLAAAFFLALWVFTWLVTVFTWERNDAGYSMGMSSFAIPLHFVLPIVIGGLVRRSHSAELGSRWNPYALVGLIFGVVHFSVLSLVDMLWLPNVESGPIASELVAEALAFAVGYAIICAVLSIVGGIVCRVLARIRRDGSGSLEPPNSTEEL